MPNFITKTLIDISRKAIRFLKRDYFELELLQNTKHRESIKIFTQKAVSRTKNMLDNELSHITQNLFYNIDSNKLSLYNKSDAVVVSLFDSITNFSRSIPFFALSLTYFKNVDGIFSTISTVHNFCNFDEIYYAEKGSGVWVQKNDDLNHKLLRLRVSSTSLVEDSIIATDTITNCPIKHIITGSLCYNMVMFVSGKVDIFYSNSINSYLKDSIKLMIIESGGLIVDFRNDTILASNSHFVDLVKTII